MYVPLMTMISIIKIKKTLFIYINYLKLFIMIIIDSNIIILKLITGNKVITIIKIKLHIVIFLFLFQSLECISKTLINKMI